MDAFKLPLKRLIRQETDEEMKTLTFEELQEREFLKGVRLLLITVWSGLDSVCTILDKYGSRTSHAVSKPLCYFRESAWALHARKVYIHGSVRHIR